MKIIGKIKIDDQTITELFPNTRTGDQHVSLNHAMTADGNSKVYFLITNGDPVLVTEENVAECADDMDMDAEDLRKFCNL